MERIAQPVTRNPQLQKIMPGRIEVAYNKGIIDPHASRLKARIKEDLGFEIDKLEIIQVYIMEDNLSQTQLEALGENLFTDPIIQHSGINTPLAKKFDWVVEVGFRPGVTDNVGKTSKEAIEDFLKIKLAGGVFSSNQYLFWGDLNTERIEIITKKILANQLIHRWSIIPKRDWDRAKGAGIYLPLVKGKHKSKVTEIPLKRSLEELLKLSKDMVWALNVEEMAAIQNYFKRSKTLKERETLGLSINPTDVEMEAIAQTWSEHCKHKIFNALITYDDGDND
ncbi:MAG: phosphoribosylformylglycinamidine synthase, partial [Thermodesulfobacteriota bacterium]|nr:phosphoribosylformylglycinamidine synthase [Thermodesulfobacteriota bacterium]